LIVMVAPALATIAPEVMYEKVAPLPMVMVWHVRAAPRKKHVPSSTVTEAALVADEMLAVYVPASVPAQKIAASPDAQATEVEVPADSVAHLVVVHEIRPVAPEPATVPLLSNHLVVAPAGSARLTSKSKGRKTFNKVRLFNTVLFIRGQGFG
jgi:hypothetical protein